ncbi:hypothetical protein ACGFJC_16210 [Nonomuraea fuscirosea]|uniref:hypothetical protein n=1 Tax=Nonomuraea fuscirosea TaxID=1291556 RepID=UPI003469A4DB
MVVHVGPKALLKRRVQLRQSADELQDTGDTATVCLLLFYAAECGLKQRILVRGTHRDSSAVETTHDLRKLAKDLGLPRTLGDHLDRVQTCRLAAQNSVAFSELHQAWRYGAKLEDKDEKEAQAVLRALITWCEKD